MRAIRHPRLPPAESAVGSARVNRSTRCGEVWRTLSPRPERTTLLSLGMPPPKGDRHRNPAVGQRTGRRTVIDPYGRRISYLRVSVTDRCDFRCVYCMAEAMTFLPKPQVLTLEEIDRLCTAFVGRGVRKLRITGGEPLVRRDIMVQPRPSSAHRRAR